jgi:hypothetical protein
MNTVPKFRIDVDIHNLLTDKQSHGPAPATLNHNLACCYNDDRVIKWLWSNAIKRSFEAA